MQNYLFFGYLLNGDIALWLNGTCHKKMDVIIEINTRDLL